MDPSGPPRRRRGGVMRVLSPLLAWLALTPAAARADDGAGSAPQPAREGGSRQARPPAADDFTAARHAMVETIERHSRRNPGEGIGREVLDAMERVPRHEFVPEGARASAYLDSALPIGQGQTISQPYIVALMTQLAAVEPGEKVLEVGTGSGYQAAVLAELGAKVFTIEIVEELGHRAAATFARLGIANVRARIGDGYDGWPEEAPFDAVVITAAPEDVPAPLVEQLAPGGRLVVPVGKAGRTQQLTVMERLEDGSLRRRVEIPVLFVPMTRD